MPEFKKPQQAGVQSLLAVVVLSVAVWLTLVSSQHSHQAAPAFAASHHAAAPGVSPAGKASGPSERFSVLDLIAKPLRLALNWIHLHVVSNWGWSILALTLCVNLALLPMRLGSMRSQLKLQRLQPEIAAIKARFRGCKLGDPRMQEMNQEIFALQRRAGVTLFGNLLPLLIQMPLLYGFYRMLRNATELRHSPWLWLHDLSAPDPFHILPIFLLLTAFLLQWLAPSPGADSGKRRIMALLLPLVSCLMTWKVGAGLALYWSCGNLIALAQQFAVTRSTTTG